MIDTEIEESNLRELCVLNERLKKLKKKLNKINRPILRKINKQMNNITFDENLDEKISKDPNHTYWVDKGAEANIKPHEVYKKYLNCTFKNQSRHFSADLDEALIENVNNKKTWLEIGFIINKHPFLCLKRYIKISNKRRQKWTEEEDNLLLRAIEEHGDFNFGKIASLFENKSKSQCKERFKKISSIYKKGKWSNEEDELLRKAVDKHKNKGWVFISTFVPGRSDVQCRERWMNSLDPIKKRGRWSKEEDVLLFEGVERFSYSWSKIASVVKTRTDSQCRRRYILLSKKVTSREIILSCVFKAYLFYY